jgi:hypothetical protein
MPLNPFAAFLCWLGGSMIWTPQPVPVRAAQWWKRVRLFCLMCLLLLMGCEPQKSPRDVFIQFRDYLSHDDYSSAYSLLDDHAKTEFATTMRTALQMSGFPSDQVNSISDYKLFEMVLSSSSTRQAEITDAQISGDTASLEVISNDPHGGQQRSTVSFERSHGRWLIHSAMGRITQR